MTDSPRRTHLFLVALAAAFSVVGRGRARRAAQASPEESLSSLAAALARAEEPREAVELFLDAVEPVAAADVLALALVDEEADRASGFALRGSGDEVWWRSVSIDLANEVGGMATAARERIAFAVYDTSTAANLNQRLTAAFDSKSAAFVPLADDERLVGVLAVVSQHEHRHFSTSELEELQRLADEAAPVLRRMRSADALRRALARERLVGEIARKVRSELDLDDVLGVAVSEIGRALGVARCFIRLGGPDDPMPVRTEWTMPGLEPIGISPDRLAVSSLAAREGRTVAIGDIVDAPELDAPGLGGGEGLVALGSRAALATPISVFDEQVGVFALHRTHTGAWSANDIAIAEAVAGEVGVAIHVARLLQDDERRLGLQTGLVKAAQVVTSDLGFESGLRRLVDEVARLFGADAADCWMFDPNGELRCRAVLGLPESDLDRVAAPAGAHKAAIESGRPVRRDVGDDDASPFGSDHGFANVMVAPITWLDEPRGVLGVYSREPGRFDSAELEVLDAFARFASLASHNAESFESRERQARIQLGFFRIAEVLGSPLSLGQTIDALAQAATEALGGASAAVLEPGETGMRLAGSFELPEKVASRLAAGVGETQTPLGDAAQNERIVVSRLEEDDRFDAEIRTLLRKSGYTALLAAPVSRAEGGASSVAVLFREERDFTEEDLAVARRLSAAARAALERSDQYEAERRGRRLSEHLAKVAARLVAGLAPARVHAEVAAEARELLSADAAAVRIFSGAELVVSAASGVHAEAVVGTRSSSGVGILGDVAQSRRPAHVEDATAGHRPASGDQLLAAGLVASLAVPMISHGGGIGGVLSVYAATPRTWRADESHALVALAAMAAAALTTAELNRSVAEEKERSEAILSNIADGIVAVDEEGTIVLWNSTASHITGVPASEALGRRVAEVLQRELASGEDDPAGEREVGILRGGKEVRLSVTEAVIRTEPGAGGGRVFAFRDVSAEREVETMKSEFVAAVSHELRTPLTSIYGFSETLLRDDVHFKEADRATFLGYIASESARLIRIVDDLLTVARLEAGALGVDLGPVDVAAVVAPAVAREEQSGYRFAVQLKPDLVAQADAERLAEVVQHLVENAIRLSPEGETITIAGRRRGDVVEVRVTDRGAGIAPSDRTRIFTKFLRRRLRRPGGPRDRGGAVPGTRPRGRDARPPVGRVGGGPRLDVRVRAARIGRAAAGSTGRHVNTTVLVVDDEAPIRLLCRVNLEAEGFEVTEATDGPAGLEAARAAKPDLILLDVMMPGMDGWTVAEQLLADDSTSAIPIVFLTARADVRDQARGIDLGGVDYVTKPFNPTELSTVVGNVVAAVARGEREQLRAERVAELRELFELR